MKLQTRISFPLLAGMLAVIVMAQGVQFFSIRRMVRDLVGQNSAQMQAREQENAENIFHSAEQAVAGSLERGEMVKFKRMLESQRSVKGLLEFSLYDRQGVVSHSSELLLLKNTLGAGLKEQLLSNPARVTRRTAEAVEIYQPQIIRSDCVRCHTDWEEGGIGGVIFCRISTAAMAEMTKQSTRRTAALNRANIRSSIYTVLVMAAVLFGLVVVITRPLIAALSRISANLFAGAAETTSAASQVAAASQSLAEGAAEQAASLEETGSSLEEMASMTKGNAENSQKVNDLARQAREAAERGTLDMKEMSSTMDNIKTAGADIAKIIKTIDEIAFQTNILALNAAVEAARAGEAGLGFAVVADEVRSLAQRSAQAAKEIAGKIEGAIKKTDQGVEINAKVAQALANIVARIRQVDELAAEVASASREQTQGINQVNLAVGQMDQVTQRTAASAEESASAANELDAQAESMKGVVAELLALVGGKSQAGNAPKKGAPHAVAAEHAEVPPPKPPFTRQTNIPSGVKKQSLRELLPGRILGLSL